MIEARDLSKFYGDRKAIGPLSFTIAEGEVVGFLGLNGAGKTTALRVLACDLLPSSGTVRVGGVDVVDRPDEVRRRVGYLPEHQAIYGEMTVREYLVFAARLRGLDRKDAVRRAGVVEETTQLGAVRDDPIGSLSFGFRQRVGIAQAVVHGPDLLVLDEPITGLDPVQIIEMRQLIRGLRGKHTIALSSHILSEISETCDRLLVVRDGEIVAAGTEAELSARLLRGVRVEVTVRGAADRAAEVVRKIAGVGAVDPVAPREVRAARDDAHPDRGDAASTIRVEAERDVREEIARALVEAQIGLLELRRAERELESIFLRLTGEGGTGEGGKEKPS